MKFIRKLWEDCGICVILLVAVPVLALIQCHEAWRRFLRGGKEYWE